MDPHMMGTVLQSPVAAAAARRASLGETVGAVVPFVTPEREMRQATLSTARRSQVAEGLDFLAMPDAQERTEGMLQPPGGGQLASLLQVPTEGLTALMQARTEAVSSTGGLSSALVAAPADVASWATMATPRLQHELGLLRQRCSLYKLVQRLTVAQEIS